MGNFRRMIFVAAAVTAAFIQGCGCSDSKRRSSPPPESTYTVTGMAAKGILRNFQVAAHRFNAGVLDPLPITTVNTTTFGAYTLNIPQTYINQPLLFRVTPNPTGSIMTCDLSAGCGTGVDFGDDLPITDSEFELDTVVESTANNSVANITLLTSLAAQLAQEAIQSGASVSQIQTAIAEANSRVANRFGLTGNLTTLPVIDLTNPTAVSAALNAGNASHVHYAALNAAIIQAARADNNALGFLAALTAFINYFMDDGIAGNTTDPSETSYADILAAARSILTQVQSGLPQASSSLIALLQSLLAEQTLAENEEPDNRSQGTPSTGAGATDLQKAKNMVADLVDFAASVGESSLEGGTDIATVSEAFAMQLEAAEMTTGAQAGYLLEALAKAAAAIDDANRAYDNNNALRSYTSTTGIDVAISVANEEPTFAVEEMIQVATDAGSMQVGVTLEAHNGLTVTESSNNTKSTITADGEYRVEGKAASAQLELLVKEGSHILVTDLVHEEPIQQSGGTSTQSVEAFDLRLDVTLAQKLGEGSDPLSLDGSLAVTLADVVADNTGGTPETESTELSLGNISLSFSGKVSNTTDESFSFALSVAGDATGLSFVDGLSESMENYAELTASLAFTAKLTGIPNVVSVAYSVERTALESAANSLIVKYPGKMFRFEMNIEDGEPVNPLTVTNQDAAVLTLNEVLEDGESLLKGNIKVNGTQHAIVDERQPGLITFTFSDGSIRSL